MKFSALPLFHKFRNSLMEVSRAYREMVALATDPGRMRRKWSMRLQNAAENGFFPTWRTFGAFRLYVWVSAARQRLALLLEN